MTGDAEVTELLSSSRAPLLTPSPLRTGREGFPSSGASTRKRPREKRGRGLIQRRSRPARYRRAADSHGGGKSTDRVGSRTNRLPRRHLLCFLHRFLKSSRV